MRKLSFFISLIILIILPTLAAWSGELISRIEIEGNNVISEAKVISRIKVRPGQFYRQEIVDTDIKNIIAMGFFENVRVRKEDSPEGLVIVFELEEKPVVKKLIFPRTRFMRRTKIEEAINIKEGSFVDDHDLNEARKQIQDLYREKGFTQTKVSHEIKPLDKENEVEVTFIIEEKGKIKVRQVTVEGNESMSTGRILRLMKTRKAWLFAQHVFKKEVLRDDLKRVVDFYRLRGFSDVTVDSEVDFDANGAAVTIKINEGGRYYLGEIKIQGYAEVDFSEIVEATDLEEGGVFSEHSVNEERYRIREVYVNKGYIFSQVEPFSYYNLETQKVDVTFTIVENEIGYVERIDIKGNNLTKDKVIRRELRVYPGDRYDGKKVKKSRERLENLGFFKEIRLEPPQPGSLPNHVNLTWNVTEAKTGYVSFGGGYSTINEFLGFVELRQRNFDYKNFNTFTGAGQDLSLTASLGTLTDHYQLSFTNPWIFDRPVSFGFDAYKKGHEREEDVGYAYNEDIRGGDLRLGREFNDFVKGAVIYRFERVKISDILDSASAALKEEVGTNDLISTQINGSFDNRDNVFVPSRGMYFFNQFQYTGGFLGGDKDFTKSFSQGSVFLPLVNKSVIEFRARVGIADPFGDSDKIPIYARFFAGGSGTIRGYHERSIGPIDPNTKDPIGGEALFVGNVEYTYPILDFFKLATFFDTGNVWEKNDDLFSGSLKSGSGIGFRLKTPIGPISIDYGWPLDLEPGETKRKGRFHFNVSRGF